MNVVLVAVALFAVGETLYLARRHVDGPQEVRLAGRVTMSRRNVRLRSRVRAC